MPDKTTVHNPVADASARLQETHNQYMAALQDAWSALFKSYNELLADYVKAQEEILKGCAPSSKKK